MKKTCSIFLGVFAMRINSAFHNERHVECERCAKKKNERSVRPFRVAAGAPFFARHRQLAAVRLVDSSAN